MRIALRSSPARREDERNQMNSASSSSVRCRGRERGACRRTSKRGPEGVPDRLALPAGAVTVAWMVDNVSSSGAEIGEEPIDALDLGRRERDGARGIAADRVDVAEGRRQLVLDPIDQPFDAPGHAAGGNQHADLHDRRRQRRERDQAEKDLRPEAHAFSRERACS